MYWRLPARRVARCTARNYSRERFQISFPFWFYMWWLHQPGSSSHWNWRCPKTMTIRLRTHEVRGIRLNEIFFSVSLLFFFILWKPQRNSESHLQHRHLCGMYAGNVSSARAIMQNLVCSFKIIVCLFCCISFSSVTFLSISQLRC